MHAYWDASNQFQSCMATCQILPAFVARCRKQSSWICFSSPPDFQSSDNVKMCDVRTVRKCQEISGNESYCCHRSVVRHVCFLIANPRVQVRLDHWKSGLRQLVITNPELSVLSTNMLNMLNMLDISRKRERLNG